MSRRDIPTHGGGRPRWQLARKCGGGRLGGAIVACQKRMNVELLGRAVVGCWECIEVKRFGHKDGTREVKVLNP